MELSEVDRFERGIEDGSARWTAQGLSGCGINVIKSECVGLRKRFTDAEM
jgi:hypothetical protein